MPFKQLEIIDPILKALSDLKYATPTTIQSKAIPLILAGKDVLGSAQTGTGKTAAFAIPILQHLYLEKQLQNKAKTIKALVVTPTRELAIQIADSFTDYGKYTGLKNTVVFGGVNQNGQTQELKKGIDILVATPGRLLDLIDQKYIDLRNITHFVLDEADRMLDMGFIHDIRKIIALLPEKRQSLFFSATMPQNIVDLSRRILKNPSKVEVSPVSSTAETIKQFVYYTNRLSKNDLLHYIITKRKINQVLVFARTKHGADRIDRFLKKKKINSAAIHGEKAQNQRQKALSQFKTGEVAVLVATDIAARGIDIDKLHFVINFDIPNVAETYVHRIGRSGRAGENGMAFSICEPEENTFIKDIEKLINQKINVVEDHPFPQTDHPMTAEERKVWNIEKIQKKKEFFERRKSEKPTAKRPNYKR